MCNDSSIIFTQKCSHLYNNLESFHFFIFFSCISPYQPTAALRVHDWGQKKKKKAQFVCSDWLCVGDVRTSCWSGWHQLQQVDVRGAFMAQVGLGKKNSQTKKTALEESWGCHVCRLWRNKIKISTNNSCCKKSAELGVSDVSTSSSSSSSSSRYLICGSVEGWLVGTARLAVPWR